jgi:predicted MFS family arabinose efflux permease
MSGIAALAPFRTKSFRFQWPADLLTAWALEMETLILGWYVLVETGSVLMLTVFASLQFVGTLISPLLGTIGDRVGLRSVLAAMRFWYATFAAILMALAMTNRLDPMLVLVIAAMSGLVRPSDIGIRSALVGATVPPAALVAAMGISRTTQDSARVGGALAGAGFMVSFGMAPAYMLITAIYLGGALLTLMISPQPRPKTDTTQTHTPERRSPWQDVAEGLVYVWRTPCLLAAMSLAALVNLTAFPLTGGLMPYIARNVFHQDQNGLGLLIASFASGAFVGSVTLSIVGARVKLARTMLATCVLWYLCLVGFILATSLPVAMAFLACAGIAQSLSMVTLAIMLLRTSEERFRGRIMGVRMLAIYTLPLGLLIAGFLIPRLGYHTTALLFVLTGLALTAQIAVTWRADLIRRDAVGNAM